MAHIDRLITALVGKHADALVLEPGEKPALVMAGQSRPVAELVLKPEHVTQLVAEIAPAEERAAIGTGKPARFSYTVNGATVSVSFEAESTALIKVVEQAEAPPAEAQASARAPASKEASANAKTPASAKAPASMQASASPQTPASTQAAANGQAPVAQAPAAQAPAAQAPAAQAPATAQGAAPGHIDELFHLMIEKGASDLHLSSGSPPILRVDGEMAQIDRYPEFAPEVVEKLLRDIAPDQNWQQFVAENDTDFAYQIEGLCRFRSNLFRDRKGPGAVFRAIPSKILTVDDLSLSQEMRNLCYLTKGLVLVTGPTGSGKSTTLTALIDLINDTRTDHIITIEDPIEFVHENKRCLVNQREVHAHTEGFKRALRAALREDPDIVLVGELRDLETVSIALETAETGHLVFGTLHTTSAVSTVDRLIDQFPAGQQGQIRVMLAETLKGVIAQVLLKKKGGGRVAAHEVLIGVPSVSNLIREGKTFQIPSIMQTGRKHGMRMMNDSLLELVKSKVVEPEEAYMKAVDKTSLVSAFNSHKIPVDFATGDGGTKAPERAAA